MIRRTLAIGLFVLMASATPSGAAPVDSNTGANVNGGGCYPQPLTGDLFSMLNLVNPEWAPVLNGTVVDSAPVLIHGTVLDSHGQLGGDFPQSHVSSDMVAELDLDPADADRAGSGQTPGHMAIEWEARALPAYAWPGEGDRVTALGRWIFDCGHPDAVPGNCSVTTSQQCIVDIDCPSGQTCVGTNFRYSTELHSPHAIASIRQGRGTVPSSRSGARPFTATRADFYVGDFAGGGGDRCVLTHLPSYLDLLGYECYKPAGEPVPNGQLSQPVAQINAQDFQFDIPLPPRPAAGGGLKKRLIKLAPPGGRRARLRIEKFLDDPQPHLTVTVRMTAGQPGHQPTGYAGTLFAGWRRDETPLTHVRVTIQSLVINNPLKPTALVSPKTCSTANTPCASQSDCPAGELCLGVGPVKGWYMDAAVNGEWQQFTNLEAIDSTGVVPQSLVYDQYLPASGEVRLLAMGKSKECVDTMYAKSLTTDLGEQGLDKGANCLLSEPRSAGVAEVAYAGPDFGAGVGGSTDYETPSVGGQGGHCSATVGTLCVGNADCPGGETCVITGGSFSLRYRIERLP